VNNLRHLRAILMLPITVTIIIPYLLIAQSAQLNVGWGLPYPLNLLPAAFGMLLICIGLILLLGTVRLFMSVGEGTLAPWDPTQKLVVTGIYRYVRNPMISGVIALLLGEAVLFGSAVVLAWALIVITVNMVYMPLVEEPGLRQRFGADYDEYARNVPRWLPRRTPWIP
jgi:protein-S-isoprenylcysteine O-methyltransferase Ste14